MTLVGRGILHDCKTSIFTKVRLQLYRTPLLVMEQVPGSSSQASLHCLAGICGQDVPTQARWSSLVSTFIETMRTETETGVFIMAEQSIISILHVAGTGDIPQLCPGDCWSAGYIFLSP